MAKNQKGKARNTKPKTVRSSSSNSNRGETMKVNSNVMGYLPNDTPPPGQMALLGFQHVLTMFPATAFVAALCGFHVGTVLTLSGIGTIVALLLSKWRKIGRASCRERV